MAFAKAEALTMVCMKNRFWTLIALGMTGFLGFERPGFFLPFGEFSPEFSPIAPYFHRLACMPGEILIALLILVADVFFAAVSR